MNSECSGTSQDRKSHNFKSDYRTKLNPRKKNKDSQNFKPKYNLDGVSENSSVMTSSKDSSTRSKTSKKTTRRTDDGIYSRLSHSDGALQKLIAEKPNGKYSAAYKDKVDDEDVNEPREELPSKMWWVPPLKTPSSYKPPSITMSSKSYSIVSSVSRPRVIRSAEDLRKKVISECNLMETVGYDKLSKHNEEIQDTTAADFESISSQKLFWVPSLNLQNSNQSPSTSSTIQKASPKMATSKASLPKYLTKILHKKDDSGSNNLNHLEMLFDIKPSESNFFSNGTFHSTEGVQDFTKKTYSNQSVQYEDVYSSNTEPYFTMGDIARKHIVNPIATKLARLCTKQGQLYIDVIDDLEKSCKEFEDACKNRVL